MTNNLNAFLKAVSGDKEFIEKLKKASPEAIIALAKEKGFALTTDDLKKAAGELTDSELEAVAGGVIYHRDDP